MRALDRTVEHELARLAEGAHGVVTRTELLEAGISSSAIGRRLRSGALLAEHPGVYRVGHRAPDVRATYLAAVRACGPEAALSGPAAAHLHGLTRGPAPAPEVTAPTEHRLPGVRTRRARSARPSEVTLIEAIPVTTVARTLVDLAAVVAADELARACHEAGVRHRTTPGQVEAILARRPTTPGTARLRAVLRGEVQVTLSALERRFLARLREAGLPAPRTNVHAGRRRVDCRWPEPPLTVELDGYRFHGSRHAWEQDRRREREARARGDEFRRYTYGDVFEDPGYMLAELQALLGAPGRTGRSG
jgi:phosphoribosylcarboxyaminoimidazole (NCAIR) mutase